MKCLANSKHSVRGSYWHHFHHVGNCKSENAGEPFKEAKRELALSRFAEHSFIYCIVGQDVGGK